MEGTMAIKLKENGISTVAYKMGKKFYLIDKKKYEEVELL
jgi:translation elongation factor P/translation initiation factor 5A